MRESARARRLDIGPTVCHGGVWVGSVATAHRASIIDGWTAPYALQAVARKAGNFVATARPIAARRPGGSWIWSWPEGPCSVLRSISGSDAEEQNCPISLVSGICPMIARLVARKEWARPCVGHLIFNLDPRSNDRTGIRDQATFPTEKAR